MVIEMRLALTVALAAVALVFTSVECQDYVCEQEFFQSCNATNTGIGVTRCCNWTSQKYSSDKYCLCYIFGFAKVNNSMALEVLDACGVNMTGVGTVCPGTPPPSPSSTPISAPPPTTTSKAPPPPPYDDSPPAPPDYSRTSRSLYDSDPEGSESPQHSQDDQGRSPEPPLVPKKSSRILSTAAIAGIAAGGAVLLLVAGVLLFLLLKKKPGPDVNKNNQPPLPRDEPYAYQPPAPPPNVQRPPPQVSPYGYQLGAPAGIYQGQNVNPQVHPISSNPQFDFVEPRRPHPANDYKPWNPRPQHQDFLKPLTKNPIPQPPRPNVVKTTDFSKSTITYEELSVATNGFSADNLLGESRLGLVYRGKLDDGRDVAVKKLNKDTWKRIGDKQLQKEIEKISSINHINLVALVGYCITSDEKLLVYEYVPNNTLEFHLHGSDEGQQTLHWPTRMSIVLGSAKGLAYLHEQCRQTIIHGDIKASNILLDDKFEPQIADFGLDKLFFANKNRAVIGTFGYIAPEYAATGKLTTKSDVFSFGVVILELITGLEPASESGPFAERSMVDWAIPLMTYALQSDDFIQLVDQELENKYDQQQMRWMVACALACLRSKANLRPKMSEVLHTLEGEMSMDKLNHGVRPGESIMFRPADVSDIEVMRKSRKKSRASKATTSEQYPSSEFSGSTSDK